MNVKKVVRWILCVFSFLLAIGSGSLFSGLLLIIAGILFMPIKQVTERIKSPINIILAVVLLVVGVMTSPVRPASDASASSGEAYSSSEVEATSTPEPTATPEPSLEPTPSQDATDSTDSNSDALSLSTEEIAQLCELTVKDNYDNYKIDTTDDSITLNVWSDSIAVGTVYAKAGNEDALAAWNKVVNSHVSLCDSLTDLCSTCGRDDVTVMVNVLNDQDLSKTLLTVVNGITIYDAVND